MQFQIRFALTLILTAALVLPVYAGENEDPAAAQLRQNLLKSGKNFPSNLENGYLAEGRFILKATGEEIEYGARYSRMPDRWAADFSQENSSRNIRYAQVGKEAWIASPEITVDLDPFLLPYMARFDFFTLYDELLHILQNGKQDPLFAIGTAENILQVRGRLRNGWEIIFLFNAEDSFPRKALVTMAGETSASWLFAFARPDGSGYTAGPTAQSTDFEILFSEPVETNGCTYPRRTDFVERGKVIGTFFLEKTAAALSTDDLYIRPDRFPWSQQVKFTPRKKWPESSFYTDASDLASLRDRLEHNPWKVWNKTSRVIALWARTALRLDPIIPDTLSVKTISAAVTIGFLGFVFMLVRRRNRLKRKFSWGLFAAGALAGCILVVAGIASVQIRNAETRSLFALHSALRYAVTQDPSYGETTQDLLVSLNRVPARSMEELGRSCQAYALAYDLVRTELKHERRQEIEGLLFDYAKPLLGASHGWISAMSGSGTIAAGLGMIGLAIGCEPYIQSADEMTGRALRTQLTEGLYRAGPGPGIIDMDSAANFFYGLKHTKRSDYYSHPSFQEYVRATLEMMSPVGTLPLFGDTSLDQSALLSMFFIKTANLLSEENELLCISAYQRYWEYGRYYTNGVKGWMRSFLQYPTAYYHNPYALLQYTRSVSPGALPSSSAVLGNGQAGILRTGNTPDDLYLALNVPKSNLHGSRRDILTFDLYAYRSLLLHGPGFPGERDPQYRETQKTAAGNSITFNSQSQAGTKSSGITASLLDNPAFDYIQASADNTYDYGQVRREVVMARPDEAHAPYFLLIDTIDISNPETTVQWRLHGSREMTTGVGQTIRWAGTPFGPPLRRSGSVDLAVAFPTGFLGNQTTEPGILYFQNSSLNRESKGIVIEWVGSRRFVTLLFPYTSGSAPEVETLGDNTGRIGNTDWISTGDLDSRLTAGPLAHVSRLTVVRDRTESFPALLMISGIEFQFGAYSLSGTKPLTVSLDGLLGALINSRPDTVVEIHSPEIKPDETFILDGQTVTAVEAGALMLRLKDPGRHYLRRAD